MSTMREIGDEMQAKHDCIECHYEVVEKSPGPPINMIMIDSGRMIGAGVERIKEAIAAKYDQFSDADWEECIVHVKRTGTQRLIVFEVRHDDANVDSSEE